MRINETPFAFLPDDCIKEVGEERGRKIYQEADDIFSRLEAEADYKDNNAIREHIQMKLLPPMAYYKALLAEGYDNHTSLDFVRKETIKTAEKKKAAMSRMSRLPFSYSIYRMCVKKFMMKNFPSAGWKTEWIRCDGKEIHFNLHSCIYWDMCCKYDCPEICTVYCENDNISFSGLLPKIRFERSGTLGNGADYCDFHFRKMRIWKRPIC